MKINFDKTRELKLVVEGKPVRVLLDEAGKPLSVSTGCWMGGDDERITKLALSLTWTGIKQAAAAVRNQERTANSTKTLQDKAETHWSQKYLKAAHEHNPSLGAERLRQEARVLAAVVVKDAKKRDEITTHQAKKYLKSIKTNAR